MDQIWEKFRVWMRGDSGQRHCLLDHIRHPGESYQVINERDFAFYLFIQPNSDLFLCYISTGQSS